MDERRKVRPIDLILLQERAARLQRHTLDASRMIHEKATTHRVYAGQLPGCAICIVLDESSMEATRIVKELVDLKRALGIDEGNEDGSDQVVRDLPDDAPAGEQVQPDP